MAAFADSSIHCLYRDSLKPVTHTNLNLISSDDHPEKRLKHVPDILHIDLSWLGNILLVIDVDSYLYLFKLPPQIDCSTPISVPYATTILEYCLVTGLDWLDLLLVLRPGMLDAVCDRLTESFNRQNTPIQQYFYVQFLCIKTSLYR